MTRELTQQERDQLEALIDATSVRALLEAIAQVCREKAQHIEETWQDMITAAYWDKTAKDLEGAAWKAVI